MGFPAISLLARLYSLPAGKIFRAGQLALVEQVSDYNGIIGNKLGRSRDFSVSFPVRQGKSGRSAACS